MCRDQTWNTISKAWRAKKHLNKTETKIHRINKKICVSTKPNVKELGKGYFITAETETTIAPPSDREGMTFKT